MNMVSVCFVCLGNICRSPTAEGVMRRLVADAGLVERIGVDSAGTGDWHIGEAPDERARQAAGRRGYDLSALRARQIDAGDFGRFDLVVAMDDANVTALHRVCPPAQREKIRLLMDFAPQAGSRVVADPYFGGAAGFEAVLDQCEAACAGLLDELRARLAG
ncbi:low molecular weight protein-tyrosine-phosphatase [Paraburkholderia caballeronis]|uniref:protein-tyrosine-phosphatase n=1 Tax=Paraburkholderia caballeronis TaxID=416943 RepID=A0A1H7N4N9_9BURK|nr:low molecular weight protein-tyrosine-phosphatase [Paraburkholderia caballeronis]PXW26294.1 protein tyrosine phosphatase [Paraburkholderia caballeronis]PXX01841.1 protein tyrosine phosphatase [Paraburkholderia caballeronis]RAK00998.1 protein tyrosine phosphatase [Paraburkholderia caballeronis]TDV20767.1 protein tyrosine phosphatase [Paraburkholderia caballeronis]TDV21197.1 protein tyrosine phosphatase [Paraburkholderia caballeronis]